MNPRSLANLRPARRRCGHAGSGRCRVCRALYPRRWRLRWKPHAIDELAGALKIKEVAR